MLRKPTPWLCGLSTHSKSCSLCSHWATHFEGSIPIRSTIPNTHLPAYLSMKSHQEGIKLNLQCAAAYTHSCLENLAQALFRTGRRWLQSTFCPTIGNRGPMMQSRRTMIPFKTQMKKLYFNLQNLGADKKGFPSHRTVWQVEVRVPRLQSSAQ